MRQVPVISGPSSDSEGSTQSAPLGETVLAVNKKAKKSEGEINRNGTDSVIQMDYIL